VFVAGGAARASPADEIADQAATAEVRCSDGRGQVIVDGQSYEYLKGAVIRFRRRLERRRFRSTRTP
jgi:Fe-S cluster assembly iron-binding protein IscA